MRDKLRVALVGVYPPPYGGVSIHIQRLMAGCRGNGMQCAVYELVRYIKKADNVFNLVFFWNWLRFFFSGYDIVHQHTTDGNWFVPAVSFFLSMIKGSRYVLSYHSMREGVRFNTLSRRIMICILKSAEHIIAINTDIKEKLATLGARLEKISVIPSFLPPPVREEEVAEIPRETWDFMAGHKPVIAANAYAVVKYRGQDLYGIDMCIDLCAALIKDFPGIGVVFCLPRIGDYASFEQLKRRVVEKGVENSFLFQTRLCQFYPVIMKSDILVRPTNTDSYGISVAEAIHFKVPAVASDVCLRPEGTVVFKSRDIADFIAKVKTVWENHADSKRKLESPQMPDVLSEILAVYREAAGSNK